MEIYTPCKKRSKVSPDLSDLPVPPLPSANTYVNGNNVDRIHLQGLFIPEFTPTPGIPP